VIHKVSAVEEEGRLDHRPLDSLIIQIMVFIPFRQNGNGMAAGSRFIWIGDKVLNMAFIMVETKCAF
jgi:hypothetical protein